MPRKQRLKDEDGENVELPSGLLPSKRIARKPRKQRLKDEDEEEDDELMARGRRATRRWSVAVSGTQVCHARAA